MFQCNRVTSAVTVLCCISAMSNEQALDLTELLGRLNLLIMAFKGNIYTYSFKNFLVFITE